MNSTGISRSKNRYDRTIKPSSPGMPIGDWAAAQLSSGCAPPAASAAADAFFRNSRREFISPPERKNPTIFVGIRQESCQLSVLHYRSPEPTFSEMINALLN